MKTRVISAAVLIVLVVACFAISPITRILFILAASVLAIWEMCRALKTVGAVCSAPVLYIFIAASFAAIYFKADRIILDALFFAAIVAAMLSGILDKRISGKGALAAAGIMVYPTVPFLIVAALSLSERWLDVFALACVSTWICDSFALFGGKLLGKHKLCPEVSPNKTVEGSISGALFAVIAGGVVGLFIDIPVPCCMLTAFICSTLGQAGDLAASLIKRMAGLKDYSDLIPGHGGIMDRIDSLLFSIPSCYFCLLVFGVI